MLISIYLKAFWEVLMLIIRSLVTNTEILGSVCTCFETATKMSWEVGDETTIILWAKGAVGLTWGEVKVGSRQASAEERSPEASADFEDSEQWSRWNNLGWKGPHRSSHSKPLPGEHSGVCYKNVKTARPLWINNPQQYYCCLRISLVDYSDLLLGLVTLSIHFPSTKETV